MQLLEISSIRALVNLKGKPAASAKDGKISKKNIKLNWKKVLLSSKLKRSKTKPLSHLY